MNFDPKRFIKNSSTRNVAAFNIMGTESVGKTHLAATASAQFPSDLSKVSLANPVTLSDIFWWSFDDGALDGLKSKGIFVEHAFDVPQLVRDGEFKIDLGQLKKDPKLKGQEADIYNVAEMIEVGRQAARYAHESGCKFAVIDTASEFEKHALKFMGLTQDTKGFGFQNDLAGMHYTLRSSLTKLNIIPIFLFHTKVLNADDAKSKAKAQAKGLLTIGEYPLVFDLFYANCIPVYTANAGLNMLVVNELNARTSKYERKVWTQVKADSSQFNGSKAPSAGVKNRYEGVVPPVVEPNLRNIFNIMGLLSS